MFVIVGLGNPGEKYKTTRHNAGRIALSDLIESAHAAPFNYERHLKGEVTRGKIAEEHIAVVYPGSSMNLSGNAVAHTLKHEEVAPAQLIVVHDDIDLPIGTVRVSFGRGSGGHNGVASIVETLGTKDFVRIRVGISPVTFFGKTKKPQGEGVAARFVLASFSSNELKKIEKAGKQITSIVEAVIGEGVEAAMNRFN